MRSILQELCIFLKNHPHSSILKPIPHASVRFRNYSVANQRFANEFSFARRKARILAHFACKNHENSPHNY